MKQFTGLIIGVKNSADANRTVEVMTKDDGVVRVFASGARRLSSRFMALTNLYTLVTLECNDNGTLNILTDGKCLGGYFNITQDIDKFTLTADVLNNVKLAMSVNENKSRLYGLAIAFMEMLDKLDFEENNEEAASTTVKLYIYMLAFLGIDVAATALQYKGGECLARACEALKGRKVSDAMMTTEAIEDGYSVYELLKQIYKDTFDMYITASF